TCGHLKPQFHNLVSQTPRERDREPLLSFSEPLKLPTPRSAAAPATRKAPSTTKPAQLSQWQVFVKNMY
ncbi:hypothetical protein TorRG33x02_155600, partial [Trema orientale]